jgi:hypothetical protein
MPGNTAERIAASWAHYIGGQGSVVQSVLDASMGHKYSSHRLLLLDRWVYAHTHCSSHQTIGTEHCQVLVCAAAMPGRAGAHVCLLHAPQFSVGLFVVACIISRATVVTTQATYCLSHASQQLASSSTDLSQSVASSHARLQLCLPFLTNSPQSNSFVYELITILLCDPCCLC